MSVPTVSAVVRAYNAEECIGGSLSAILGQTHRPLEVIVVDDGSTDGTADVLATFATDIRVIRQSNGGPARALNRGFAEAAGDYLATCDADDIWLPHKLERQLAALAKHPEIDIAFCGATFFGLSDGPRTPHPDNGLLNGRKLARRLYRADTVCMSSTLIRRRLYLELGPIADQLAEDYDYWLRALAAGARFFHDPEALVRFRHSHDSVSRDKLAMHRAELCVHDRHSALVDSAVLTRRVLARDLRNIGRECSDMDRPREARAAFISSLRRWPTLRALVWAILLSAPDHTRRTLASRLVSTKRALLGSPPR
jgi:glycosyltransferase involved in cell wall biosynthesis